MKLGIFAKTFEGTRPGDVLPQAAAAGYDAVQYNMACSGIGSLPTEVSEAVADAVASAASEAGISIAAVSATYNMIHPDSAVREQGRAAFSAIAAQARRMGTNLVTLCTGSRDATDQWRHHPDNESGEAWSEMLREFQILIPIAERYDIPLGVEPELGNVVSSAHKARALIDTMRNDRIKIVLDAANLFETEAPGPAIEIVKQAIHLLEDSIVMAHAKDRNADGSFTTAGRGVIDFGQYIAALRGAGFTGALVTHGLAASEAPGVASFLRTQLNASAGA
jgi:sugar phosphate isomerase/epimerase